MLIRYVTKKQGDNLSERMFSSTLTELLKTFSQVELKEFEEFMQSPYFNKRQAVISLYREIIKYHPEYNHPKFNKSDIFQRLFPGKEFNDGTLRVLIHYLNDLAEKFLAFSRFENSKLEYTIQLQAELRERKQYKLLEKSIKKANELLTDSSLDAEEYFFNKYRIENMNAYYLYESNYAQFEKMLNRSGWEYVLRQFTIFYQFKTMIMYINILTFKALYNKDLTASFQEEFEKIDISKFSDIPVFELYYYLIKMLTEADGEEYFFIVKKLLSGSKSLLNKFDVIGAYVNLSNFCVKKISLGDIRFEKERFSIYKEELVEKTYLMNDGFMSPIFFKNVVSSGLSLGEYSWVKNFIEKYKSELSRRYRDNYTNFCMALYEFSVCEYENSMELNSKIKYDEIYMKLSSKVLQMQLFFEMNIEDSLASSLENFRHFLNNDALIPAVKKIQYENFHKYLTKILNLRSKKDKIQSGMLKEKLQNEKDVLNKQWLLEKID